MMSLRQFVAIVGRYTIASNGIDGRDRSIHHFFPATDMNAI